VFNDEVKALLQKMFKVDPNERIPLTCQAIIHAVAYSKDGKQLRPMDLPEYAGWKALASKLDAGSQKKGILVMEGPIGGSITATSPTYIFDPETKTKFPVLGNRSKLLETLVGAAAAKCEAQWYGGKITYAHSSGTFDIRRDDGSKDKDVPADLIKVESAVELSKDANVQFQKGECRREIEFSIVKGIMDDPWMAVHELQPSIFEVKMSDVCATTQKTIDRLGNLFIDNKFQPAEGGATLDVKNPADGKVFAKIAHASVADVDKAVKSSRACFDSHAWSSSSPQHRVEVLQKVSVLIRARSKELAFLETKDCGKPLGESEADVDYCADAFEFYAKIGPEQLKDLPIKVPEDDFSAHLEHEPLGVIAAISPWNFPLLQAVNKVAPALAAGCTVVLKPSPLASLTCLVLGELVAEAGAPPGALNVITGGPPDMLEDEKSTGQSLIDHPGIDKVSFTGSTRTGQKMLEASAPFLRPTSLELGGKSAFIVFEDASPFLDDVIDWILVGIFLNSGQVCCATSRLLVHKDIEPKILEKLRSALQKIKVGDPLLPDTQMGPLISEVQHQKVLSVLETAKTDGCSVESCSPSLSDNISGGYYIPPTMLTNVNTESNAWVEEIFGPVLAVRSFTTEEEAISLANNTTYGLANAVFSADTVRLGRVASQLKSGLVWRNCSQPIFPGTPFGGRTGKKSGFGREQGVEGLMEYIHAKTVVTNTKPEVSWNWYGLKPAKI